MKQIYFQNQNQQAINKVSAVSYQLFSSIKSNELFTPITTFVERQGQRGARDIFLVQNKGKGPPGRQRSPGAKSYPEHPPDGEADQDASPLSFGREGQGVSQKRIHFIHTKQNFYNTQIQNFNFLQTLNFLLS